MDPITHGVIGLAISAFSGDPVSLTNPISIGAALGAMAPDLDAVTRVFFNDMVYLKHHRGKSHSVPALAAFSIAITIGLSFIFPNSNVLKVLFFTFMGALSHTIFDILNSYGAMLFRKKKKLSLLMLYDPVVSVLALFLIFYRSHNIYTYVGVFVIFKIYILTRYLMKRRVLKKVSEIFANGYSIEDITVLPGMMAFHKWDFIINAKSHNIVGQYNVFRSSYIIRKKLKKNREMRDFALTTNLGEYFEKFSPNFHVIKLNEDGHEVLKFIDLRYFIKGDFMHHGTIELDPFGNILGSYFQPYELNRKIAVNEN
jgi:inner membrane protein